MTTTPLDVEISYDQQNGRRRHFPAFVLGGRIDGEKKQIFEFEGKGERTSVEEEDKLLDRSGHGRDRDFQGENQQPPVSLGTDFGVILLYTE